MFLGGLAAALALLLPSARGAELPLREIIQALPLPEVQGQADIQVRKKHWRLFQPSQRRREELQRQGIDPRWRYGPVHNLEIKYKTRPQIKTAS